MALADVLLPNENEALALTGQRTVADALAQLGELAPVVAIKRGAHGAMVLGDGETTDVPALAAEVADTIGAGDAFDAGFVAGFLAGLTPVECARMGCACGSLSTRAVGGVGRAAEPGRGRGASARYVTKPASRLWYEGGSSPPGPRFASVDRAGCGVPQ